MSDNNAQGLDDLRELCDQYDAAERRVAAAEAELDAAKKQFNRLRMDVLPEVFSELGLKDLTLETGAKIEITGDVSVGITEDNKKAAHAWLRDNGFEDIIKTQVDVEFDRSEFSSAVELQQALAADYPNAHLKQSVHHSTLKSFVKERLANGDELPMELFGARAYKLAKLKR